MSVFVWSLKFFLLALMIVYFCISSLLNFQPILVRFNGRMQTRVCMGAVYYGN